MPLYNLEKNQICIIEEMPKNPLLYSLGVRKGITISIMTRHPFGGPIVVKIGNRNVAIDKNLAQAIITREVA